MRRRKPNRRQGVLVAVGEIMPVMISQKAGPLAPLMRNFKPGPAGLSPRQFALARKSFELGGLGGAELNVVRALGALEHQARIMSAVGRDAIGRGVLRTLRREGTDIYGIRVEPRHPTGIYFKGRAENGGDPEVKYRRRSSAAARLVWGVEMEAAVQAACHLHCTGITPALSAGAYALQKRAMLVAREAGRTVSFDPNLRPTLWGSRRKMIAAINQLAAMADWVLPGLNEGQLLTGRKTPRGIADFYLQHGVVEVVVIKLGAAGAYFRTRKGKEGVVPGVRVRRVVDTVGAGDAFAAGFLSGMLEDLPIAEAVARGNRTAAEVIQVSGDCLPPLNESRRRAILYGSSS